MSSRLFLRIREELGLAYSVASLTDSYEDAGSLGLYAGVSPENALPALEALVREWVRLREEPITPAELNRARELYRGGMLLGLENSAAVVGQQVLDGGQVTTLDEALRLLEAVDSEAVLRLARDLIQLSKVTLAVVGPFAGEEPFLEHLQALIQEAAPSAEVGAGVSGLTLPRRLRRPPFPTRMGGGGGQFMDRPPPLPLEERSGHLHDNRSRL
jgi:hypothetical protein